MAKELSRRRVLGGSLAATGLAPSYAGDAFAAGSCAPQSSFVLATGQKMGPYDVYAGALKETGRKNKVFLDLKPSDGPAENLIRMKRTDTKESPTDIAMVTLCVALQAWHGAAEWTGGEAFREFCALFPIFRTSFHGVALKSSGINRLSQLHGKVVGVGPRGSTSGVFYPQMLNTLGIPVSGIRYGKSSELARQLSDGLLDAFLFAAGTPYPEFTTLASKAPLSFLGFAQFEREWLAGIIPGVRQSVVKEKTYEHQDKEIEVLTTSNLLICHRNLCHSRAQEFTFLAMKHLDDRSLITNLPNTLDLDAISSSNRPLPNTIPCHDGVSGILEGYSETHPKPI